MKVTSKMTVGQLVSEMNKSGVLGAGRVAKAVSIMAEMFRDPAYTVFLTLAGPMIPGGLRRVIGTLLDKEYVDVILNDTENDVQYYGWGWFEIRNFWTKVMFVEEIQPGDPELGMFAGNYSRSSGVYAAGDSVLASVAAFEPPQPDQPPQELSVTNVQIENIQDEATWPPNC